MDWINLLQPDFYKDMDSLCLSLILGILGVAITIFTVVFSFMENNREKISNYKHIINNGMGATFPTANSSLIFAENNMLKMKHINNKLLLIIIIDCSLLIFFIVAQLINNNYVRLFLYILTALLLSFSIIVIFIYIYDYWKKIKKDS